MLQHEPSVAKNIGVDAAENGLRKLVNNRIIWKAPMAARSRPEERAFYYGARDCLRNTTTGIPLTFS